VKLEQAANVQNEVRTNKHLGDSRPPQAEIDGQEANKALAVTVALAESG